MDSLSGQQLLRKDETVVEADSVLADKKIIAFYFSAHWCPPCRLFTPVLAEFYSVTRNDFVTSSRRQHDNIMTTS